MAASRTALSAINQSIKRIEHDTFLSGISGALDS